MASGFYKEALKKGQKEKRICINEGRDPYLPSLDKIISSQDLKRPEEEDKSAFGLYEYRGEKKINLAMPI